MRKSLYLPALIWLLFITVLFFIPGSALPEDEWMSAISFDKWIHVGLFTILLYLWSRAVKAKMKEAAWLLFSAVAYGYLIEVCQDQLVTNRSFDWGDLIADGVGSIIGISSWAIIKK